jgi:hypothetical protein
MTIEAARRAALSALFPEDVMLKILEMVRQEEEAERIAEINAFLGPKRWDTYERDRWEPSNEYFRGSSWDY